MPIYSTTRSKTSPDRSKILVCVFTLISSFGQQVGYAYWAPLRDVNAWIDGMRVHFSVYDPVREQEMVGSGPWTNQDPTNVIVNDGVVAWLQGTHPCFTVYDPIRGYWQTGHELNVTTTVNLLTNEDGVVAYIRENTNVNLLIFDPATGPSGYWVKANGSFSNIALSEFRNQDGVVAWVYGNGSAIDYAVYNPINPSGGLWQSGRWSSSNIRDVQINAGTVSWTDGTNTQRHRGWQMYAQPLPYWDQVKPTETTALFFAGPITGRAPLTVWFWDMSLGGTSWSWDFGDGGTSGARSPYYTYQNDGQWVAAHTVNGPGGTDLFAIVIDMLEDTTPTAQPTATNTPTFRPTSTNTSTPFPTATGTLPTPTPTRTGSLPPTSTPTRTPTLDSHATPSPTPMCQELIDILLTMQQQPVPFEEILEVVLNWYQTNVEPTPTPRPGTEVFQSGDALIDFSVFPDGSQMNGVPSGFTPGTYLVDQFASAGVRFRSTISPYPQENPLPADLGCGVVGGPSDNYLQGMRYAPPNGMDARTVFEVRFDSPVRRAGVLRSRGFNFSITNAITRFYDSTGSLIVTRTTSGAPAYHSLEVPSGNPGVKRIEITSSDPVGGNAGGIDDLMFSQVGDLSVPPALLYEP